MPKREKHLLSRITSLNGRLPKGITRFNRYTISGTTSMFIDLCLLLILTELLNLNYLISAGLAYSICTVLHYFISRSWGFPETEIEVKRGLSYFFIINIIGLIFTLFIMQFIVENLGIYYLIGKLITAIIVGMFNFTLNYNITFRVQKN